MKVYVIKSCGQYLSDAPKSIHNGDYGPELSLVESVDEAKNFRTKAQAKTWIKKTTAKMADQFDKCQADIDRDSNGIYNGSNRIYNGMQTYHARVLNERLCKTRGVHSWLEQSEVVEIESDDPTFLQQIKIVWNVWRVRQNTQGKSLLVLFKDRVFKSSCTCCGLRLKYIPYYNINSTKICIPCLYMRMDTIKAEFEKLPEDFRTKIINEYMIANI